MAQSTTWLVGDIGATNARFGLMSPERALLHHRTFACEDHATIADALTLYLGAREGLPMPRRGALAIASAITGDRVAMTNHPWSFSVSALRAQLGFERLEVINDFTAVALALPYLGDKDRLAVGGGGPVAGAPVGVIGAGSGLGVSGLVPAGERWIALTGEGGHATMAPADARESAVLAHLRGRLDHVSAERLLSGPGLVNLYNSLCALDGVPARGYTAAEITDPVTAAADPHCRESTRMFCAMLGMMAGNLALTLGARGGVHIAGGIVPRLGRGFAESPFRERFEAKGRMHPYLAAIPTYVITHPFPAFVGCATLLAA
ncbi:MAG: glucokinase [Stellaceae bacterium]